MYLSITKIFILTFGYKAPTIGTKSSESALTCYLYEYFYGYVSFSQKDGLAKKIFTEKISNNFFIEKVPIITKNLHTIY